MKKFIIALLLCVMAVSPIFSAGYPVVDINLIFETVLEKMETLEHYAKQVEHMKTEVEHYIRQYEQILRYYEELKGLREKFANASFKESWNNTKQILQKMSQISKAQGKIEDDHFKIVTTLMNQHAAVVEYINDQKNPVKNELDKLKQELDDKFEDRFEYYEDAFMAAYNRNTKAFEERRQRKQDSLSYYTQLLDQAKKSLAQAQAQREIEQSNQNILHLMILTEKDLRAEEKLQYDAAVAEYVNFNIRASSDIETGSSTTKQVSETEIEDRMHGTQVDILRQSLDKRDIKIKDLTRKFKQTQQAKFELDMIIDDYQNQVEIYQAEVERLNAIQE